MMGVPRAANTGASRSGGFGTGTVGLVVTLAAVLLAPATALASPAQVPATPKSTSSTAPSATPKSRATRRASLTDIEAEVMCPICGTLLELSESPQAQRERAFIERLIAAGKTKAQIKDALVAQYGPRVLALPRASGFDLSAYLIPAIAFLVAAAALAVGVARWRRNAKPPDSAPPAVRPPRARTPSASTPTSPATTCKAHRPQMRGALRYAGWTAIAGCGYIRSGAEMPSRPSARGDRPLRQQAEREPRALDALALRPDHLAVAVEGVEVGGDRGRVGADPVRGAPRRRLADLVGQLEQALDQRLLGGLQRRARRRAPAPAAAASASSPALRRMLAIRACAYWT